MVSRIKIPLIFTLLTVFLFLVARPYFAHVEFGVYSSYSESIVEDGDYNLVDEMFFPGQKIATTSTGYYPNFHSHAGTVIWAPFYTYGKLVSDIFKLPEVKYDPKKISKEGPLYKPFEEDDSSNRYIKQMSLVMSTIFISMLGLMLLFKYLSQTPKFNITTLAKLIFLAFISSPFLYYTVYEPGNATINAVFLSFLTYVFYKEIRKENKTHEWFLFGVFHAIAFAIKVDTIFYMILLGEFILFEIIKKKEYRNSKYIFSYIGGFLLGLIPQAITIKSILGVYSYGYSSTLLLNYRTLIDTYFSSYQGVLTHGPFFTIVLVLALISIQVDYIKKFKVELFVILAIIAKILAYGLTYSHGSGIFGGRQFIPEIPFLLLFLTSYYDRVISHHKVKRRLFRVVSIVGSLWSFFLMTIYIGQQQRVIDLIPLNNVYSYYFGFLSRPEILLEIISKHIVNFSAAKIKLVNFFPLFIIIFGVFYLASRVSLKRLCFITTAYITSAYLLLSGLNLYNGSQNVSELRDMGYYTKSLVGKGAVYSVYYENLGSIEERMLFLKSRNRLEEYKYYATLKNDIKKSVTSEIISFPNNESREIRSYFREFEAHERLESDTGVTN